MTDWRKHDPLCPTRHPLTYPRGYCLCDSFSKIDARVRADERAKWLKWAAKNACCEAGLVASPGPCPWHPDGVRERIAEKIEEKADDYADWDAIAETRGDMFAIQDAVKGALHDAAAIARGVDNA